MPTVQELQADLEQLPKGRASPALEVQFSDHRRVIYRSESELAAAIAAVERQIATMTTTPVSTILVAGSKGLDT